MSATSYLARPSEPSDGGAPTRLLNANNAVARTPSPEVAAICVALQELGVRRKFLISATNKQTNMVGDLVRRMLGFSPDLSEKERAKITRRAARIVAGAFKGEAQEDEDAGVAASVIEEINAVAIALEPILRRRKEVEKAMVTLAKRLPVYPWANSIKGFGDLGLAVVVAETGDLSNYPNFRHVWKRLGLAPIDGKAGSTWRLQGKTPTCPGGWGTGVGDGAGYSPQRRAQIYGVVGAPLIKAKALSRYGEVYAARRVHTAITHPVGTFSECKADANRWTPAHSHNDAERVMTKTLISDLWSEWRREPRHDLETILLVAPAAEPTPSPETL